MEVYWTWKSRLAYPQSWHCLARSKQGWEEEKVRGGRHLHKALGERTRKSGRSQEQATGKLYLRGQKLYIFKDNRGNKDRSLNSFKQRTLVGFWSNCFTTFSSHLAESGRLFKSRSWWCRWRWKNTSGDVKAECADSRLLTLAVKLIWRINRSGPVDKPVVRDTETGREEDARRAVPGSGTITSWSIQGPCVRALGPGSLKFFKVQVKNRVLSAKPEEVRGMGLVKIFIPCISLSYFSKNLKI